MAKNRFTAEELRRRHLATRVTAADRAYHFLMIFMRTGAYSSVKFVNTPLII